MSLNKTRRAMPWLYYPKANRVIINAHNFLDTDAAAYIAAVETADGAGLASKYSNAINDFVVGCKADGIWTAIKAACLLAGPATIAGALVPLVGTAPTNVNFVGDDHTQATGLLGDGSTKYLNSNRASNADPQNNHHNSVYIATTGTGGFVGAHEPSTGIGGVAISSGTAANWPFRSRLSAFDTPSQGTRSTVSATGFLGISRSGSTNFVSRLSGANETITSTSAASLSVTTGVFARRRTDSAVDGYSNARLSFFSIGGSINLALLDSRIATYMAAIA